MAAAAGSDAVAVVSESIRPSLVGREHSNHTAGSDMGKRENAGAEARPLHSTQAQGRSDFWSDLVSRVNCTPRGSFHVVVERGCISVALGCTGDSPPASGVAASASKRDLCGVSPCQRLRRRSGGRPRCSRDGERIAWPSSAAPAHAHRRPPSPLRRRDPASRVDCAGVCAACSTAKTRTTRPGPTSCLSNVYWSSVLPGHPPNTTRSDTPFVSRPVRTTQRQPVGCWFAKSIRAEQGELAADSIHIHALACGEHAVRPPATPTEIGSSAVRLQSLLRQL